MGGQRAQQQKAAIRWQNFLLSEEKSGDSRVTKTAIQFYNKEAVGKQKENLEFSRPLVKAGNLGRVLAFHLFILK